MSNWIKRLLGISIAVALTAGVVAISAPQLAAVRQDRNNVPAGELVAGRRIGQSLQAPFSALYRVDVLLATYARKNQGPVTFRVEEGPDGPNLVEIEIEADQIQNNAFHSFVFEPLANPAGQNLLFFFEAPEASKGNAITVWQTDYDAYPGGQAYVNNHPAQGDLTFIAYYRSNPPEMWHAFSEHVRSWNPYVWQARWFLAGVAVTWIVGIGLLLGELLVASSKKERR